MHVLVAKEYLKGQTPLAGEYALYKDEDKCYFVVGDGVNTIENTSFPVFSVPENVFNSMKRLGEKYPPNKGPYRWEDLDEHDLQDVRIVADFQYCKGISGNTNVLTEWDINPPNGITDEEI